MATQFLAERHDDRGFLGIDKKRSSLSGWDYSVCVPFGISISRSK
jgi:hypothetical protein